jgi:cell wall-associated NlpC family hydrolase
VKLLLGLVTVLLLLVTVPAMLVASVIAVMPWISGGLGGPTIQVTLRPPPGFVIGGSGSPGAPFDPRLGAGLDIPPGNVSLADRAKLAAAAGWTGEDLVIAVAVSCVEDTTGDPAILSATNDLGLWQINQQWWPKFGGRDALVDPMNNALAGHWIWANTSGWNAWTTYRNGAYRGCMDRARAAVGEAARAPQATTQAPANGDARFAAVWAEAQTWLGVPYLWGGCTRRGVDCSCFVKNVYATVGVALPRTTVEQRRVLTPVGRDELRPGDVVFFNDTCTGCGANPTHEGLYVGNGQMIQAGGSQVSIQPVFSGFYGAHYAGAGRVP